MKQQHYISFNIPREKTDYVRQQLETLGCGQWWEPPSQWGKLGLSSFQNTFDSEDARLTAVKELAKREHLSPFERVDCIYTDEELLAFPLLRLSCNRSRANGDYPGRGTEYDFSTGCPQCGRGAQQASPLMVTKEGLSGRALMTHTLAGEILLGEALVKAWKAAGVMGVELRQIVHYRTKVPISYWQVIPAFEMPEMTRESKFLKGEPKPGAGCPACRRGACTRSILEPWEYAYSGNLVKAEDLPDVVRTWECFGTSRIKGIPPDNETQLIAQPDILVKPKVFDLFRRLMLRQACFEPVRIVD